MRSCVNVNRQRGLVGVFVTGWMEMGWGRGVGRGVVVWCGVGCWARLALWLGPLALDPAFDIRTIGTNRMDTKCEEITLDKLGLARPSPKAQVGETKFS
jgi:hypothetical protein